MVSSSLDISVGGAFLGFSQILKQMNLVAAVISMMNKSGDYQVSLYKGRPQLVNIVIVAMAKFEYRGSCNLHHNKSEDYQASLYHDRSQLANIVIVPMAKFEYRGSFNLHNVDIIRSVCIMTGPN